MFLKKRGRSHWGGGLPFAKKPRLEGGNYGVPLVKEFYEAISSAQKIWLEQEVDLPDPPCVIHGFQAVLRSYQTRALSWMLFREGLRAWSQTGNQQNSLDSQTSSQLSPTRGGILADEMGLGKTVEVLALIMHHRRPLETCTSSDPRRAVTSGDNTIRNEVEDELMHVEGGVVTTDDPSAAVREETDAAEVKVECMCGCTDEEDGEEWVECERCRVWHHVTCSDYDDKESETFICVKCLLDKPYRCKATLVICPRALSQQWSEEIARHTCDGAVRVMVYPGVSVKFVSPMAIANCDLVLVSYEVLNKELYHVTCQEFQTKLRRPKRFMNSPSPLTAVEWWRVVLDEAQMVENTSVKAAEMVGKLKTINKWCVSGTPIQKGLQDLYGLLYFLGVEPYVNHKSYLQLLWNPFINGETAPMIKVFSDIMWRKLKSDVANEIRLPSQTEVVHRVSFRSIEEYYYQRQIETCQKCMESWKWPDDQLLSSFSYRDMTKLLIPLHSLRQACCTPGIVRSGYLPQDLTRNVVMTMDFLLSKLTQQAKVEARESLRLIVSNLNGLAGLYSMEADSIFQQYDVMCWYEEAIRTWEVYKQYDVDCDKLQRIHVLENLAEMLDKVGWSSMPSREGFMALYPDYKRPSDNIESCGHTSVGLVTLPEEDDEIGEYHGEENYNSELPRSNSSIEDYFDSDDYDDYDDIDDDDNVDYYNGIVNINGVASSDVDDSIVDDVANNNNTAGCNDVGDGVADNNCDGVAIGDGIADNDGLADGDYVDDVTDGDDYDDISHSAVCLNESIRLPEPETVTTFEKVEGNLTHETSVSSELGCDHKGSDIGYLGDDDSVPLDGTPIAEQGGVAQELLEAELRGMTQDEQNQDLQVDSPAPVPEGSTVVMIREDESVVVSEEESNQQPPVPVTSGATSDPECDTVQITCDVQGEDQDEEETSAGNHQDKPDEEKLILRSDVLMNEAKLLREDYVQKEKDTVQVAMATVRSNRQNTHNAWEKLSEDDREMHWSFSPETRQEDEPKPWWTSVLLYFQSSCCDKQILSNLRSHISNIDHFSLSKWEKINDYFSDKIMSLKQKHAVFWEDLENLFHMTDSKHKELLEEAVTCHLDTDFRCDPYHVCLLCQCKMNMVQYQEVLFSFKIKASSSMLPGEAEECLKSLLSVARHKYIQTPKHLVSAGESYMNYLEALRKEFPSMLQLWIAMESLLGKRHELFQAKAKLFLYRGVTRQQHFLKHKSEGLDLSYVGRGVNEYMVPTFKIQWKHEKNQCVVNLKKQIGRIVYLNNLEAQQNRSEDECCAVCTSEMGVEVGMFPCGHTYCKNCTSVMLLRPGHLITCPMCREVCYGHRVRYVLLESRNEAGDDGEWEEPVANVNHTSKILAVVKTLLSIQKKEPGAKALVFSWWGEVLTHISHCLDENLIKHALTITPSKFQANLSKFKTDPSVNVLLLPFKSGSKGLNIVEATHVLLVEPQLNLDTELQAIGRVHRIGQTKPTTVHRFVVRGTVEEHIYQWTKKEHQGLTAEEALLECNTDMTLGDVRKMLEPTSLDNDS